MKKASRFWIWLFLFSLFPVTTSAQVQRYVSKQEALSIAQGQFRGQDVDYYLIDENKSPTWQVFVDAEPMKGWKHDCYVIRIPKSLDISHSTQFPQQWLTTPPQGEYTPLLVTNRYGNNANSKPRVKKAVPSSNEGASTASRTYAVILSGGVDKFSNYERYWNDCSFIYQTLVNKYGVPKQNIYPIMSDGDNPAVDMHCTSGSFVSQPLDLDFDGVADIHLAATKDNVRNTLSTLSKKLNKDDHLFFFVIDHGASENANSFICLWNNGRLSDSELANMLDPFCKRSVNVNVVLGQCFAGGFNEKLKRKGIVVASAARGNEFSWACPDIPYDEFVYQWTCAVNGATHTGSPVQADKDNNGRVTMEEAFDYALKHDRRKNEHPVYNSTPLSVGEDLAFNHLAPSVDLYIPDDETDTGKEPNTKTTAFWKSPYIWVRNQADGVYKHENPEYSLEHPGAFVYVRVYNRGKDNYTGGKYLVTYWANASTGFRDASWKGRETNADGDVSGGFTPFVKIEPIEAGKYRDVRLFWPLPDHDENDDPHYCLLAKIMDQSYDDGYVPGVTYFDVLGANDQAQKNVTIIRKEELTKAVDVYVRNVASTTKSYTLELVPQTAADAKLYSMAKVEMEMSPAIYDGWVRGGMCSQNLECPAYQSNGANRVVKFVSAQSQMQKIQMKGEEFDVVRVKFDFFKTDNHSSFYTFDLIQKDDKGNIIGGETFVVESPILLGPVVITPVPTPDGSVELNTDSAQAYKSVKWMDGRGETLGEKSSVVVNPKATGYDYSVVAMTEEGDMCTGSITLEKDGGIKSVGNPTPERLIVALETPAPAMATLSVTSVLDGTCVISCPVAEGAENVSLDTSRLSRGVYVVSYSVNSELIDQKKVRLD